MSKASLFNFLVQPGEVLRGVKRLGAKGALLHGVRRTSTALEKALLGPAQLRINPMGAVCNHTCPMCWLQHLDPEEKKRQFKDDRENGMQLADYVAFFDGMPAGLTEVNVVGGGEPLVHHECVEIMAEIKRRGWQGYLITNGTLLDEDKAQRLVDMRWDLVRVSTHAGDARTYELVQGVDHFERLRKYLSTYDRLRRAAGARERCKLHVHHVLQRENLGTLESMFRFGEDVGADYVVFEIIFALAPDKRLTPDELEATARELGRCASTAKIDSNSDHIVAQLMREHAATSAEWAASAAAAAAPAEHAPAPGDEATPLEPAHERVPVPDAPYRPAARCSVGFDSAFVTSHGDVLPCCFSNEVMGNVRQKTFKGIWKDAPYEAFRKRLINGKFAQYCIDVRCKLTSFLHD